MEHISDDNRIQKLLALADAGKAWIRTAEDVVAGGIRVSGYPELAEVLRELLALREQNRWILCSERMPDEFVDVLIAIPLWRDGEYLLDGGKGKPSRYHFAVGDHEAGGFLAEDECYDPENVTHWRPLPAPPVEG